MEDCIGIEKVVHGQPWNAVHGGYFSDPETARPLVETAACVLARSPADVVVDLGGGTGFLLSQLAAQGAAAGLTMVNLDCSREQLALTAGGDVLGVCASVDEFDRGDLASEDQRLLYIMRSVLHYAGEDGLSSVLYHLRDQARAGEFFVHQTASFEREAEAACLNALYERMHTGKWYPTVSLLKRRLVEAGWRVVTVAAAPALLLTSEDLAQRYGLTDAEIRRIRDEMAIEFGQMPNVFQLTSVGFQARLHYRIYTCVAGPE